MPASPERAPQHPSRPPGARGRAVAANGTYDFSDARRGGLRPRPDRPHPGTYAGRVPVRTAPGADPHPEPGECDELNPRFPLSPLSGAPPCEGRLFSGWWRDSFPTAAYGYAARSRITSLMWLRSLSSGIAPMDVSQMAMDLRVQLVFGPANDLPAAIRIAEVTTTEVLFDIGAALRAGPALGGVSASNVAFAATLTGQIRSGTRRHASLSSARIGIVGYWTGARNSWRLVHARIVHSTLLARSNWPPLVCDAGSAGKGSSK